MTYFYLVSAFFYCIFVNSSTNTNTIYLYIAKYNHTMLDRIIFVVTDENALFIRVNRNNVHKRSSIGQTSAYVNRQVCGSSLDVFMPRFTKGKILGTR